MNAIDRQLDDAEKAHVELKEKWATDRRIFDPIVERLEILGIEPRFDASYLNIPFTGNAEKLAHVVRILRTAGFATKSDRPKLGDYGWYAFFDKSETNTHVFLSFTSSVCKRKKVGTVMVEQPVYETVCE